MTDAPLERTPGGRATLSPAAVRNIGIVAHIDAGKTTLSERVLFASGVERRMGEVHEGTTVLDWMPEERRRGITITAAATTVPWRGLQVNLIDTPGHVDFSVEVERTLRVLDGAILVLSAVSGVQAQSEAVWRTARRFGVPTITFVNQCDRDGADFLGAVDEIERRLEVRAVPIQFPVGEGPDLIGVVDLIENRATLRGLDGAAAEAPVPAASADLAGVLRQDLIEVLAEEDEAVLEALLEDRDPRPEDLRLALREAVLAGRLQPVLCGSALINLGIAQLLDAVVHFLPSPLDAPVEPDAVVASTAADAAAPSLQPPLGPVQIEPDPDGPACALVFKLQALHGEELAFLRIYSGTLEQGQALHNPRTGTGFQLDRLFRLHADALEELPSASAGEIVAIPAGSEAVTGDTLCAPGLGLQLERPRFSEPVLAQVVEPEFGDHREALGLALGRIVREDPTLRLREDPDTGQFELAGMGELHLEVVQRRLKEELGLDARFGTPSVAFREAVLTSARGASNLERQWVGETIYGEFEVELLPDPDSGRVEHDWEVPAPSEPVRAAVEQRLRLLAQVGPRFGFPLVNARVRVLKCLVRSGDAAAAADQMASIAMREAMSGANVELLEPVMALEVDVPAAFAGGVLGDLQARGARILAMEQEGQRHRIRARVPLAELAGYPTTLRSLSQGRGSCSLAPAGFERVSDGDLRARGLVWG